MNRHLIIPLILALASAPLAARDFDDPVEYAKARVVKVEPVYTLYERPETSRDCWREEIHTTRSYSDPGATLGGAILGGVLANHLSHGDHGATAFGTFVGATVAGSANRRTVPHTRSERHCAIRTDYVEEERLIAYRVTYNFGGRDYTTRMDHDPGEFVRLRVEVTPVE